MSEPSTIIPVSLSASGYEDGLGRRTLDFDREAGVMLERLHLRAELGAFEAFLREQAARSMVFDDDRFARVRAVERDGRNVLTVVSQFVAGNRLCDLLEAATSLPADEATSPSVDAAIGFLLEVLPSLGLLHATVGHAHGTLGPGRIVLTPGGEVVILDSLFGQAIERLQFNRRRLWMEFGIATPATGGPARLDVNSDIAQASLSAMMIVLGRPLRENEYPEGLPTLVTEVIEIAQIRGGGKFASGLHAFLQRALPLPGRLPHEGTAEAEAEMQLIAREIGAARCRAALGSFVEDMNRVLEYAREEAEDEQLDAGDDAIAAAVEAFTAGLVADTGIAPEDFPLEPDYTAPIPEVVEEGTELALDAVDSSVSADLNQVAPEWPTSEWPRAQPALDDSAPVDEYEPEPFVASRNEVPEPISVVEPQPIPEWRIPDPEPVAAPVSPVQAETVAETPREPRLADMMEPVPEPVHVTAPKQPQAPQSKRKRRGSKAQRDKLQSNALPAPKPPPAAPAPVQAAPIPVAAAPPPVRIAEPVRQAPTPIAVRPAPPAKPIALKVKAEAPTGYDPGRTRPERRESLDLDAVPYMEREAPAAPSEFPWRMAAAAVVVMIVIVGVGRAYLPDRGDETDTKGITPAAPVIAKHVDVATTAGSIAVTTQPAGAHVLLDGKGVGDTPLMLDGVVPGKHALTLVTTAGTVKRSVRVEAGKSVTVDIPIYSGWIAVFSPVPLDIAENGRAIGTTEQGRLMLSPGSHKLTLTNRQLGYKSTQVVDIDPGEERSISVLPTGELSANAVPWAEVWIEGKKVGDTPLAHLQVPLGTHEIVFKNPQFPERRVTVTVSATTTAMASVDFSK